MPRVVRAGPEGGARTNCSGCSWKYDAFGQGAMCWFEQRLVDVAPPPIFVRFERAHNRVTGGVEMQSRVLVPGVVAAAHVATRETQPEMHQSVADPQAVFAAVERRRRDITDLVQMRTRSGERASEQPAGGRLQHEANIGDHALFS